MGTKRRIRARGTVGCWLLAFSFGVWGWVLVMAQPLFTGGSTVILFSGLPGDVESDNDYRAQMKDWLEVVQRTGSVKRLFILCDEPGSVDVPAGIETKVLKASRENWLALTQTIKRQTNLQTNSLLVVVWGHGGKQGEQPVFHVRGSRLKPDDFKALATSSGESRWILMFRGSGSFAREIVSAQASGGDNNKYPLVLSSDADQMFGDDPIGSAVLVQTVRHKPEISLQDLSREFGKAVASWYEERHLARAEEPALWRGDAKPQLMAEAEVAATDSRVQEGAHEDSRPAPAVENTHSNSVGAAWDRVKRVDGVKFPEADAVVLKKEVRYTLGDNPAFENEDDEFIQILKPEGKRLGDFDLPYSPPEEDLNILDCEVLGPDGNLTSLDADAIREASGEMQGDYQHMRRKFFSLPGVVPGAVIHVRLQSRWKRFPLPHVSFEIPLALREPVLQLAIEVNVPKSGACHFTIEHAPDGKSVGPDIVQETYGTKYRWNFQDVPAEANEVLAPPHAGPRLLISTFPDWQAFADWYVRLSKFADEVTPEISAKAADLTKGATTDREKLLSLYNYVTALRYVAIPLGVNSFRPHAAANVLKNQFGDCKDKANLLNALLHSLNMNAQLVLVPRFSQAHDEIPGLSFNHAISKVNLDGETVWVDTTDDVCRFGMLPPGDPGRKVLVIGTNVTGLTQLPTPRVADHSLTIHGQLDCSILTNIISGAVPTKLSVSASGYPDYLLRQTSQELRGRSGVPLLGMKFAPLSGVFAVENESGSSVSALTSDFSWSADGGWLGLFSGSPTNMTIRAPVWLPKEWELALHHRKQPLFLNEGYPLRLVEEFEVALPVSADSSGLCPPMENTGSPLRWRVEWTRVSDDKLLVRLQAELAKGDLSEEDTRLFQQQVRGLFSAAGQGANLVIPKPPIPSK